MDHLEVVFDIHISYIDKLLIDELDIRSANIKSSHFYDQIRTKDIEFNHIDSFSTFLLSSGTGTILFEVLELEVALKEVLLVISSDAEYITLEFNFIKTELIYKGVLDTIKCLHLLNYFQKLIERYNIPSIKFGYEPATDKDMCLIEITKHTDLLHSIRNQWKLNRKGFNIE